MHTQGVAVFYGREIFRIQLIDAIEQRRWQVDTLSHRNMIASARTQDSKQRHD